MKILVYVLAALLVVGSAAAGYYYFAVEKPMMADLQRLKAGQPEFEKSRAELKRLREFESRWKQDTAWIDGGVEKLKKDLQKEIDAGRAEVAVSGSRIVVNLSENVLFTPQSVTFGKDSRAALDSLASMLKEFKDKEIFVGNQTSAAPAQGKGRKRVPAKDARTISTGRSLELVRHLEKSGVSAESLVAAGYSDRSTDRGFRIKAKKTIIVIANPPAAAAESRTETRSAPATTAAATAAAPAQQKPIPITTAPPKKVQ